MDRPCDMAIVVSHKDDAGGTESGSAYLFVRGGGHMPTAGEVDCIGRYDVWLLPISADRQEDAKVRSPIALGV